MKDHNDPIEHHVQSPLMTEKHPDGSFKSIPISDPEIAYDQGFKVGFWVATATQALLQSVAWWVYLTNFSR